MLYVISVVTEFPNIFIWVTEIESMLRSENVSSSQLEQRHGGTVCFDSCYSHMSDKQRWS